MKNENYVYFILKENGNPSYSFTGYTDKESGALFEIYKGRKEKRGNDMYDIPHRWKFDEAHRSIRVHKSDKSLKPTVVTYEDEKTGEAKTKEIYLSAAEFLRRYPLCKNSPNGDPSTYDFFELKEEEDAIIANNAKKIQFEALKAALMLSDMEVKEMGALYGQFGDKIEIMRHFLNEKAQAEPTAFLDLYNSPDRSLRALLRKAVDLSIVKVRGGLHSWEGSTIGHDEDSTVAKLLGDKELGDALRIKVKGGMK